MFGSGVNFSMQFGVSGYNFANYLTTPAYYAASSPFSMSLGQSGVSMSGSGYSMCAGQQGLSLSFGQPNMGYSFHNLWRPWVIGWAPMSYYPQQPPMQPKDPFPTETALAPKDNIIEPKKLVMAEPALPEKKKGGGTGTKVII